MVATCRYFRVYYIRSFVIDVWWGIGEPTAQTYNFAAYQQLVGIASALNLKVAFIMSFHQWYV